MLAFTLTCAAVAMICVAVHVLAGERLSSAAFAAVAALAVCALAGTLAGWIAITERRDVAPRTQAPGPGMLAPGPGERAQF